MAVPWSSVQEKRGRASTTGRGSTKGVADRRPCRAQSAAVFLRARRTGLPEADHPADRQCRQRAEWKAFLTAAVERSARPGNLEEHSPRGRRAPTSSTGDPDTGEAADPHLAGLERGQLLLLRLPGLAEPLREAGQALEPGDQSRRPDAKVILSGLFAKPTAAYPGRGCPALLVEPSTACRDQDRFDGDRRCTPSRSTPRRLKKSSRNSTT